MIQSAGSSILKIAFVLMRREINALKLQDEIVLLLPYHDETIAESIDKEEIVKEGKRIIEKNMKLAAKLSGFVIGANAENGPSWYDAH